jgi:branched-chain amino acid transport system ATP-binding protein
VIRRGASRGSATLVAEGVTVRFDGLAALEAVTLEVRRGEILGLIGPNGAGKTTLLNVLSGFQRPTEGRVLCGERDVTSLGPSGLARLGVARTFQGVRVFPGLSVFENVELGALGHGIRRRAARVEATRLLDVFGLSARRDQPAGALPYGEERLLGIARALAASPDFLLLDEPAAGMNAGEGEELVARILGVREAVGCGVLLVEHDMRVIMRLSERIHVLDYGRTLSVGSAQDVRSDPTVVEAYFGTHGQEAAGARGR